MVIDTLVYKHAFILVQKSQYHSKYRQAVLKSTRPVFHQGLCQHQLLIGHLVRGLEIFQHFIEPSILINSQAQGRNYDCRLHYIFSLLSQSTHQCQRRNRVAMIYSFRIQYPSSLIVSQQPFGFTNLRFQHLDRYREGCLPFLL